MAAGHAGDSSSNATDGRVSIRGRRTAAGEGLGDVRAGSRQGKGGDLSGEGCGEDAGAGVGSGKGAWSLSPVLVLVVSIGLAMGQLSSQGGLATLCQARNETWIGSALCGSAAAGGEQVLSWITRRLFPNLRGGAVTEATLDKYRGVPGTRPAGFSCRPGSNRDCRRGRNPAISREILLYQQLGG